MAIFDFLKSNKKENNNEEKLFEIDLKPKEIILPKIDDKKKISIRYPLIPPYAYANIFWNENSKELIYFVEEPVLDEAEKTLLKIVKDSLEEIININPLVKPNLTLLNYLEETFQTIILELNIKISKETYKKLMYFIYRDFIGYNKIEPLMHDYFIEDIECNGINTPLFVVHRKYENLRTNIVYKDIDELANFVEKLAQRSNSYVSYAKPLLDSALPDGSRVNATYTKDITTKGPTFTIRKFTRNPLTPVHLITNNTANSLMFAYLWLAIEHKMNIIIIGETASGKTTFLNSLLNFIPSEARLNTIEDTREINVYHDNWIPAVSRIGFGLIGKTDKHYGEITMFDLLKESFRQNPDYVVVGEVRGAETYVLFQGMASGHSSLSTFHAGSVELLTRRLETPPINLPRSLIESLDIVCVASHYKNQEKNIRRIKEIDEIIKIDSSNINYNKFAQWNPATDNFVISNNSYVLQKISQKTGKSLDELKKEILLRKAVLDKIIELKEFDYKRIKKIIDLYYHDKTELIKSLFKKVSENDNVNKKLENKKDSKK